MSNEPMPGVVRASVVKELLNRHGFRLKKQLGQNFLIDERVLDGIVEAADIGPDDGVFEIGPGAGVVTQRVAARAKSVVAVDKDRALEPVLQDSLRGVKNVTIRFADVLDVDLRDLWSAFSACESVHVIANLPYYVTTPILFHVMDSGVPVRRMVVMVQREVADRLVAEPGGKDYGALTVSVRYRASVKRVMRVAPGCFLPPPGVDSEVVCFHFHSEPPVHVNDESSLFRVIRAAFGMRRKTLENALVGGLGMEKARVREALAVAGIDPTRRGETLSLPEFAHVSDCLGSARKTP